MRSRYAGWGWGAWRQEAAWTQMIVGRDSAFGRESVHGPRASLVLPRTGASSSRPRPRPRRRPLLLAFPARDRRLGPPGPMEEEEIERAVLAYLKKKGYKNTELAFKTDARALPTPLNAKAAAAGDDDEVRGSLAGHILLFSRTDQGPSAFEDGYRRLQAWVHSSLDMYRQELLHLLYPLFVHSFLDLAAKGFAAHARRFFARFKEEHEAAHARELHELEGISLPQHVLDSQAAQHLRHTKMRVRLCQYSLELLLRFLHDQDLMTILSLINNHVDLQVAAGHPSHAEEDDEDASQALGTPASTGTTEAALRHMHATPLHWGTLEDSLEVRFARAQRTETVAPSAGLGSAGAGDPGPGADKDGKPGEGDEGGKRKGPPSLAGGPKSGAAVAKRGKKDKAGALGGGDAAAAGHKGGPSVPSGEPSSKTGGAKGAGGKVAAGKGAAGAAGGEGPKKGVAAAAGAAPVAPSLQLPAMKEDVERSIFDDLRHRIALGPQALPSVCFYTALNAHQGLNCIGLSQDGALMAAGFKDSSVRLWDMQAAGSSALEVEGSGAADCLFHRPGAAEGEEDRDKDKDRDKGGLADPSVSVLGLDAQQRRGERGKAPSCASGASSKHRVARSVLWGHSGPVYGVDLSSDGRFLLSGSGDHSVRLWSVAMGANLVAYKGHTYPVWDVQHCPAGQYFASASHDRTARIWSLERAQPLRIMAGHLSDVDCVRWHPNCNYLATGSSDKTVRLWDVQTGEAVRIFVGHKDPITSLALSPSGRFLASGDEDGVVMLWDLSTSKRISPLFGHSGAVWSLAFSGDSALLASGSADDSVRLWDVAAAAKSTGKATSVGVQHVPRLRLLKALRTKSTPVQALQFTRRNLLLAAGPFCP